MKWKSPRSLLAASDLSESSDDALLSAAALASDFGADLHVFHCVIYPFPMDEVDHALLLADRGLERLAEDSGDELRSQVDRVLGEGARVASVEVVVGEPGRAIMDRASEVDASLIVLGRHRRRIALDDVLGTTAERIIRTAEVPCLAANRALEAPVRRILVATDLLVPSQRALEHAVDWFVRPAAAGDGESKTVVDILYVSDYASGGPEWNAAEERLADLQDLARRRAPEGSQLEVHRRIISTSPEADGIRRAAETLAPDLIVLGTRGHGSFSRLLIGSVASNVLRTAELPLLLVPMRY